MPKRKKEATAAASEAAATPAIPAARIKSLVLEDPDIGRVKPAAVALIGRATELFVRELCVQTSELGQAQQPKRQLTAEFARRAADGTWLDQFVVDAPRAKRKRQAGPRGSTAPAASASSGATTAHAPADVCAMLLGTTGNAGDGNCGGAAAEILTSSSGLQAVLDHQGDGLSPEEDDNYDESDLED